MSDSTLQCRADAPPASRWGVCGFARLAKMSSDDAGQLTVEWALVLAAIALPMYAVILVCLNLLAAHYRMVTFMETLPFP